MKKTTILCALLLMLPGALFAQRVIDVHPECNPDRKILTSADAIRIRSACRLPWRNAEDASSKFRPDVADTLGIVYGGTVSRNEFGLNQWTYPSPDGALVAVFRKDERAVTDFPLLDITTRTGSLRSIKYPMNGMQSEEVKMCVCDTSGAVLSWLQVTDFGRDRYLTGITWSPDSRWILVQVLDREQHHMHLNVYEAATGTFVKNVLTEENDAWVEPQDPVWFVSDDRFIYRTDNRDGYRSLYLCSYDGVLRRLTTVAADVNYLGNDGRYVYYTSAEVSPIENHLFRLDLRRPKAAPVRLTKERGWHSVRLSPDCTTFEDAWSSLNDPGHLAVKSCKDGRVVESKDFPDPLADYAQCSVELGTVSSADGQFENYYRLYKPLGFDPSKQYPLIVYVYGGPHMQMVQDRWLAGVRMWEMEMAQRGFVVYVQDNRGTPNRGAAFEKAINRRCGQEEMADQMVGVRRLLEEPWIDASRVGVYGWSYGGFMAISLLTSYPTVFSIGAAGGPVIDWRWYEIMYGERYMDTPATNLEGFEQTSLLSKVDSLAVNAPMPRYSCSASCDASCGSACASCGVPVVPASKLLICQGAIDDTVVWEHSLSFVQACIEHGIQVDYFPYPCSQHNVTGPWRAHLTEKITQWFCTHLQ